jgi:methionyl-tRNA formyltransferase
MRFGFVTCVELGLACMEEIYAVGGRLDLAITLQDDHAPNKSGRVSLDQFCATKAIPLTKVRHINDADAIDEIRRAGIDWLFIIGWSQIAGEEVLEAPTRGVIGMHPTLLPKGRGRASIPWAILLGLEETGVTMFQLDRGVDTGPIIAQERLPLAADETATTLYQRVAAAHRTLLGRTWPQLVSDRLVLTPQDESEASEWPGRRPKDGRITGGMTVAEADRLVRATTRPYPGAFWLDENRVLRIWTGRPRPSAAGHGAVCIELADGAFEALDYEWEPLDGKG